MSIALLDAMWYLRSAWKRVKCTTIQNGFRHGGFIEGSKDIAEEEVEVITDSVIYNMSKRL